MKPEEVFDSATKELGGRLPNASPHMNSFLEDFRWLLVKYSADDSLLKEFPIIHVDFIANSTLNAFAFKNNYVYFIGINHGVYLILMDLFNRMLAHKRILPNIGDSYNELEDATIKDYFNTVDDMVILGHSKEYTFLEPKDITRRHYANYMVRIAMRFIFEHELSHILFGHCDFLRENYGLNRLDEYLGPRLSGNFDSQTLEMDADCTSLARCCKFALNVVGTPSIVYPEYRKFYSSIYTALSDVNFAICNVLLLFGDGEYWDTTVGKSDHPDPRIRQLMISSTFESICAKWVDQNIEFDKLKGMLLDGVKEANLAYQHLTGKKINKDVFKPEYFHRNPLLLGVLDNWKNSIRGKLQKYTFKPLTP